MNTVVRARIDEKIKAEASTVLGAIGLTVSDAFPPDDGAHRHRKVSSFRAAGAQ